MTTPLEIIKEKRAKALERINTHEADTMKKVYVGLATCEIAAGSKDVMQVFQKAIDQGLHVALSPKGCVGRCNLEPTVEVLEKGKVPVKYVKVTPEKAKDIVEKHLKNGQVIKEWTID